MNDFLTALGLALAVEGACYALFPERMKAAMLRVLGQPTGLLRGGGLAAAVVGVGIVWLVRHGVH
jgi:uncharacterized protein YjeT (DUF2065 family)